MMAGMIALELNSVHNEISFSDGEMPATHHNSEFCFSSYYVTYNKSLSSLV